MKVSVEHVSQTNIGNTDSLLLYQNPSSQTTQYCTGVSDPVVYRLETAISNSADHLLQVSIPTGHNSIRPSLKCICCVRLFLRLFDQADGKTDTFLILSSPSWLLGITIIGVVVALTK